MGDHRVAREAEPDVRRPFLYARELTAVKKGVPFPWVAFAYLGQEGGPMVRRASDYGDARRSRSALCLLRTIDCRGSRQERNRLFAFRVKASQSPKRGEDATTSAAP